LPVIEILAGLLVIAGIAAFFLYPRFSTTTTHSPSTAPTKTSATSSSPAPPISATDPPAAPDNPALVKIPGDASTIAAALAMCKEGGTIELIGGTFSEPIVLTKSVSILSKSAAVFEDRGLNSSLITVRGSIQVTLRNIQIKSSQTTAEKPLESSPPLVLIHDRANVQFDGCIIEGSSGNGISFTDKASATFSNCRIRKNRGYGVNVSSGSKVEFSLSEIEANGRSGVSVINLGSSATLGSGTTISANSQHGIEAGNGGSIQASGAEIKNNIKAGLVVEGGSTTARLEGSCLISGNYKFAALVRNAARLTISNSTLAENRESGILIESGGQVEIDSCQFSANGKLGIQLSEAESSVTVTNCDFTSHTGAGALLIEGNSKISGSRFSYTPPACALVYGEAATGEATRNIVHPGPLESAIDGTGNIIFTENTVKVSP